MPNRFVAEFLASESGRAFAAMGKDASDILEAFLEAAEREAGALDLAAVDRALASVVPRLKKQRLPEAPALFRAFVGHAGNAAGLPDAGTLAARAYERGVELAREDEKARQPVKKTAPDVGRNDPCPCGSGKKYKKCCGAG